MITVIVSGMPAVGKSTLAEALAERFKLKYYCGGDFLKQIASERGYKVSDEGWWDTEEGARFLEERKRNLEFDREVDKRLAEAARMGGAVVSSYPLPWLVKSGLKVWLKASVHERARRMAIRDRFSLNEALKIVIRRDRENRRLYRRMYGIRFGEDLSVFDYVLNTESLSINQTLEIASVILKQFM